MAQTPPPAVADLPPEPSSLNPGPFAAMMDAFLAALGPLRSGLINLATNCYNNSIDAYNSAIAAAGSASTATSQANMAIASAATAVNAPGTQATSTTALSVGTGAKTMTIQAGKAFVRGMYIVIADSVAPATNSMHGQITDYSAETGALVVDVMTAHGTGIHSAWVVSLSAPAGVESGLTKIPSISVVANQPVNGMTITIHPDALDFRSASLGDGAVNTRIVSAAVSTVISPGSTGGTSDGLAARFAVLAIDAGSTVEVAWVNTAGGVDLDESDVINTVAEGGAGGADGNATIYSTTARTGVPFRRLGFFDITQANAGVWISQPSKVSGCIAALDKPPNAQIWTAMGRLLGATYYNTTGYDLELSGMAQSSGTNYGVFLTIGGVLMSGSSSAVNDGQYRSVYGKVKPGRSYSFGGFGAVITLEHR